MKVYIITENERHEGGTIKEVFADRATASTMLQLYAEQMPSRYSYVTATRADNGSRDPIFWLELTGHEVL